MFATLCQFQRRIRLIVAGMVMFVLANDSWAADIRNPLGDRLIARTSNQQEVEENPAEPLPVKPQPPLRTPPTAPPQSQPMLMDRTADDGDYFNDDWCLPPLQTWADADFLLWFRRGIGTPVLAATGNPTPSVVLYGNEPLGTQMSPGGRFELGRWTDETHSIGYGLRGFMLASSSTNYTVSRTAGQDALGIPFFNAGNGGVADVFLVADPNGGPAYGGSINVKTSSQVFGWEAFLRMNICDTGTTRADFLLGYQYSRIDEGLVITSQLTEPGVTVRDSFRTHNEFNGGTIGMKYQVFGRRFRYDFLAKIAFGNMHEEVNVSNAGSTNGGLFARSTNVGVQSQNNFCVLPELGSNFVIPLGPLWDLNMGYSFMLWSVAVQPGSQIDRNVNLGTTPPNSPSPKFVQSDYWVHGLNFGLTRRF